MEDPVTSQSVQVANDVALYQQIQHFYARQMQLLDVGAVAEWAETFTDEGVFEAGRLAPVRGRANIREAAGGSAGDLAARGVTHRHWLGMLTVTPNDNGSVATRCYALVLEVPRDGVPVIHRSTVCEDTLIHDEGGWLVRHRKVTRDDQA
jgi:SnoaL-like protein